MDFNRYFTNEELDSLLTDWAAAYPQILKRSSLGKSQEGRDIPLLTITHQGSGAAGEKPALWLDANLHATEIAGTTTVLRIVWELLSNFGTNEQITSLVERCTFYAVPRLNPDGAALAMAEQPKFIRSGTRPYPFEEKAEGLHQQDLDGDGRIVQMRIPDPNGDWKVSSLHPNLMEKRLPDEQGGSYYRVLPEGLIEDYDGYLIKMARSYEGLDFNRNYPFEWRPEAEQAGAGPFPASEPEVRAAVDFITSHANINAGIAYHTFSGVILRPYGTKADEQLDSDDLWTFEAIADRAKQSSGYRTVSVFHDFKYHPKQVITGTSNDWLFENHGIFGYVVELWDIVGQATGKYDRKFVEWWRVHPHEDDLKIFEWAQQNGPSDGYLPWRPFLHPQLGQIELGGWNNLYTWRNPPHSWMGPEAERNIGFVLSLAEMLPHLRLHRLHAQPQGQENYLVDLVVENTGFFPTHTSQQGKKRGARPVWVEFGLPEGGSFLHGGPCDELGHLEGRSNKLAMFTFRSPGTDNRVRRRWLIHAPNGGMLTLAIRSDRAGTLRATLPLLSGESS